MAGSGGQSPGRAGGSADDQQMSPIKSEARPAALVRNAICRANVFRAIIDRRWWERMGNFGQHVTVEFLGDPWNWRIQETHTSTTQNQRCCGDR
jgi:hypothetical protein